MATPLVSISPSVSPSPAVNDVMHTVVQFVSPHLFELAQIVQFLGTGAGLSILHSLFLSNHLPKWLNRTLPVVYSALAAVADVVIRGTVDWNNWYMVFVQVLTGAITWYVVVTAVNQSNNSKSLPTTTAP